MKTKTMIAILFVFVLLADMGALVFSLVTGDGDAIGAAAIASVFVIPFLLMINDEAD